MASNPTAPPVVNTYARWTLGVLLVLALFVCPRVACAEDKAPPKLPAFLHLEYAPGPSKSCPDREAMEFAIIAAARRDPLNSVAPAVVEVTIKRRGPFYVANVDVRDKDGGMVWHRPWDAPLASCAVLVRALGFLIGSALREDPPEPSTPPAPAPAKVEPPRAPPSLAPAPVEAQAELDKADRPSPPDRNSVRLNFGAATAAAARTAAPRLTFNLIASAGARWRSFSGAFEFRWTPPEAAEDVRVMQYAARIVPCGHYRWLVYCGVGEVTAVVAKPASDAMALSGTVEPSVATGARLGADLPIPVLGRHLVFRPWMEALVTALDVRVRFDDGPLANGSAAPAVWNTPRFSMLFGASILTDLWINRAR